MPIHKIIRILGGKMTRGIEKEKIKEIERVIVKDGGNYIPKGVRKRLLDYTAFIPEGFSSNCRVLDIGILGGFQHIAERDIQL